MTVSHREDASPGIGPTGNPSAPRSVRLRGAAGLLFGVFFALVLVTAVGWNRLNLGGTDTYGTAADWLTLASLLVVGVALMRSSRWAILVSPILGTAMLAFGAYWTAVEDEYSTHPNPLTGAALPEWFFFVAGLIFVTVIRAPAVRKWAYRPMLSSVDRAGHQD